MDEVLHIIKEIERQKNNFRPCVAMYMQIATRLPRQDVRELLKKACDAKHLSWGYNPWGVLWFATELSPEDYDLIVESNGWTIEQII